VKPDETLEPALFPARGYRFVMSPSERMAALPGEELVSKGIVDLGAGVESVEALLVSIGAVRLARLGYDVVEPFRDPEHRLYELLRREDADAAHSRYNALIRRLVSFERAAECAS
jgi:hypothetical protein